MSVYLKLGEKAASFADPRNRFSLSTGKVVKVNDSVLLEKEISAHLNGGHIVKATEDEYNAHLESLKSNTEVSKNLTSSQQIGNEGDDQLKDEELNGYTNEELDDLTQTEMLDELKESKMPKNDFTALKKASLLDIKKAYVKYIPKS